MSISRRDALTGATAAVAVAAVPATVQANDAQLEALYTDWRAAYGVWSKANTAHDNTRMDVLRSCEPSPVKGDYTSAAELEEAWGVWGAARQAAKGRSDIVELKRQADAAFDAEQAAFNRFMEAPAQTPRGVLLKITAFIDEIEIGGMDDDMLVAIQRDLERLS